MLGRSSYARAMIKLRADVELKDSIVVAMRKLVGEGFYMCTIRVEPVSNKNGANTSGKIKQNKVSRQESAGKGSLNVAHGSSSNTPIIDKIDKLEHQILVGKLMFVDDDGNPLVLMGNVDNKSEVEVVFDETTNLMASTSFKG
ncbi:hypothetical protein Tco_0025640 [Tanacetum coccineum]